MFNSFQNADLLESCVINSVSLIAFIIFSCALTHIAGNICFVVDRAAHEAATGVSRETWLVYFDHWKPFDGSTIHKSEPVVIPDYITLSVIWHITSGAREKNKHEPHFVHMERARVRGFLRKAKYIPRGIASSGYVWGGERGGLTTSAVIKPTYILHLHEY